MKRVYTAVGNFERRSGGIGKQYPVVMLGNKEHILDFHEMMIWVTLNWRVLNRSQVETLYGKKLTETGIPKEKDCTVYIDRLLYRGLIMQGAGETDADAMYDLFGGLHIVPVVCNPFIKIASFLKLTLFKGVPFRLAGREIFRKSAYTADERRVLDLSKQASLSTAELMKCVEVGARDISTDEKANDILYNDDYTTCHNLVFTAKTFYCQTRVLTAILNLYLRKQIIFMKVGAVV